MINMEAIPKFDIKFVIKFDISTKLTTWIRHQPKQINSDSCLVLILCQNSYSNGIFLLAFGVLHPIIGTFLLDFSS